MIKNLYRFYPLLLSDFNKMSLDRVYKNTLISNFIKFRPAGTELFHADRQTWKVIVVIRSFANAPNNCSPRAVYMFFRVPSVLTYVQFLYVL
jgi:hypothetical protein